MKLIFLDTEVTGLEKEDKLCQIAYLCFDTQTNEMEIFESLCNPNIPITEGASKCHGITDNIVKDKLLFVNTYLYKDLQTLNNDGSCLIAHNAQFDIKMLARDGLIWKGEVIDTLKCARSLYNNSKVSSFALQNLRKEFNLNLLETNLASKLNIEIKAHDAAGDVLSLYALYQHLVDSFEIDHFKLIEISNAKEKITYLPFGKYRNKTFEEVAKSDRKYLEWIINNNFDVSIIYSAKLALDKDSI